MISGAESLISGPQTLNSASSVNSRASAKSAASAAIKEASSTETESSGGMPSAASSLAGSIHGFPLDDSPTPAEAGDGGEAAAGASTAPPAIVQKQEDTQQQQQQQVKQEEKGVKGGDKQTGEKKKQLKREDKETGEKEKKQLKEEVKETGEEEKQKQLKEEGKGIGEKEKKEFKGGDEGTEKDKKEKGQGKQIGDSAGPASNQASASAESPDMDRTLCSPRTGTRPVVEAVSSEPTGKARGVRAPGRGLAVNQNVEEKAADREQDQPWGGGQGESGGVSEGMFRKRISDDLKAMLRILGGSCKMVKVAAAHRSTLGRLLNLQGEKVRLALLLT